ncbi:uncharacterized protein BO72DRAFT_470695 [Aspergillus fijiensis CBS 313.89]|uniref:Serine hydrolase domain-containing protein n=1 Tax=Aspergillus fijiensis CBS 313.89 TaxID=1448319 RepID=A0A8G1VWW0_9EURO|nr:uncharacterized protein BO72DRAFT_470695 [Aspergillus fijiensis CBS 313.89]RAK74688.1 hypothetical protein BO72DRAFT_470695 [Aspergillus fijiensis CBS 313.89]
MKIICLHPWGASAEIFERQLSFLCALIGESHEYVFLDGPVSCGPANGIPPDMPGPFYNWYDGLSSSQVKEAHDLVMDVIEAEGPFDGVIGFSQGASLALSILYHHEIIHPHRPPPFRFAVLFCAVLSISPDPMFNKDLIGKYARYYKQAKQDKRESDEKKDDDPPTTGEPFELGLFHPQDESATHKKASRLKNHHHHHHRAMLLLPGQKAALVRELVTLVRQLAEHGGDHNHAARTQWNTRGGGERRISIPTVHIIGRSDPLRRHGELQARLCSKNLTRVVEFEGAHKVPHKGNDLQAVLRAVEWAMRMAQMR